MSFDIHLKVTLEPSPALVEVAATIAAAIRPWSTDPVQEAEPATEPEKPAKKTTKKATKKTTKKAVKKEEPKEEPKAETPEPDPVEEIDFNQLQTKFGEVVAAMGAKEALNVLAEFEAEKLSDLDEAMYAKAYQRAEELLDA